MKIYQDFLIISSITIDGLGYNITGKGCLEDDDNTWYDGECTESHPKPGEYSKFCVCKHDLCNDDVISAVDKTISSMILISIALLLSCRI